MSNEKIVERIKKLLSLAGNNPSEEEASAAMLKAQELMAKYGVELSLDETADEEEISIQQCNVGTGKAWKSRLASIVADNFKCKTFCYGKQTFCFYGHETDAKIAKEVFEYLLNLGHKNAMKARAEIKKERGVGDGAYNSYVLGFLAGIKTKLDEQSTALMIVVPVDVKEQYATFIAGAKTLAQKSLTSGGIIDSAYAKGKTDGRSAMGSRATESK